MMSLYCIKISIFPALFHCMKPMNCEALVVRLMNILDIVLVILETFGRDFRDVTCYGIEVWSLPCVLICII